MIKIIIFVMALGCSDVAPVLFSELNRPNSLGTNAGNYCSWVRIIVAGRVVVCSIYSPFPSTSSVCTRRLVYSLPAIACTVHSLGT